METPMSTQGLQQYPRFLQVLRVEALGERRIYLREPRAGFILHALPHALTSKTHHRPQFEKPRSLLARRLDGIEKARFGFLIRWMAGGFSFRPLGRKLPLEST